MGSALTSLFSETRRSLLVGFYRKPDCWFYLREITRAVGKGQGAVQRELANLVEGGILIRKDEHGRSYYQANRASPIFAELRALVEKTAGVAVVVREALDHVKGISVAFVFGSVARKDERPDSDIDLAVIGDVSFRVVVGALGEAQMRLGREINPVVQGTQELRERWKKAEPFVREMMEGPKWFVIGTKDDLETMVG